MAYVEGKPDPQTKKYRAGFIDWTGKQKRFTGTTNPKETLAMARKFEDDHRQIRLGYRPAPKVSDTPRVFADVAGEYLEWGKSQGGHGGRPWNRYHTHMRNRHLNFWKEHLNLTTLADLTLPKVEAAAQELQRVKIKGKARTGKTIHSYIESIKALVVWAKGRGYLDADPLEGLAPFDTTPKEIRRALNVREIEKLLAAAPPFRRLIYAVALCTGYRKGELAALKVKDLDTQHNTLPLAAEFTKGRRNARQPIPAALAVTLRAVAQGKDAEAPLLHVVFHIDRQFQSDREKAGIPKTAPGGKAVFHSLRHSYCSLVIESGATLTEAQRLMRHTDPKLTANIYAHTRPDRLQAVAEAVGDKVLLQGFTPLLRQRVAVGAEGVLITAEGNAVYAALIDKPVKGFEPATGKISATKNPDSCATISPQKTDSTYEKPSGAQAVNDATTTQAKLKPDSIPGHFTPPLRQQTAPGETLPADLARLATLWDKLPAAVRQTWLATAEALTVAGKGVSNA